MIHGVAMTVYYSCCWESLKYKADKRVIARHCVDEQPRIRGVPDHVFHIDFTNLSCLIVGQETHVFWERRRNRVFIENRLYGVPPFVTLTGAVDILVLGQQGFDQSLSRPRNSDHEDGHVPGIARGVCIGHASFWKRSFDPCYPRSMMSCVKVHPPGHFLVRR